MARVRPTAARVVAGARRCPSAPLYVVAEGRLEVVEAGRPIEAGQMFGEIAFFFPGPQRAATVRCREPSTRPSIDEVSLRRLFFQNPAFGFEVARLIAGRLSDEVSRAQRADPERLERSYHRAPALDYTAAASPTPARTPPP